MFADEKFNVGHILKNVLEMAENFVGKGENGGTLNFLLFSQSLNSLQNDIILGYSKPKPLSFAGDKMLL